MVLGLAIGSVAAIVTGGLVLDWFELVFRGPIAGVGDVGIDLRAVRACSKEGVCAVFELGKIGGTYSSLAGITLWTSLAFAAIVAVQAGIRWINGTANTQIERAAYVFGALVIGVTAATAYLFGPDGGGQFAGTAAIERTWAPLLMLLGQALGIYALYEAAREEIVVPPPAVAKYPPRGRPTQQPPASTEARTRSAPMPVIPDVARNKLRFAVLSADISRAGIDARREDGSSVLVMWRDVVGAVARRLPPSLEGSTFVDLVSTAGATLRILPWTRLAGEPLAGGDDADARARSLLEVITASCTECQLDPATRAFVAGDLAAQLPDAELLAAHDERLA